MTLINIAIHTTLILSMPLLLLGVIGKTKAAFAGCNGPPLWQPYFDVIKLLRKDSIFSNSTTWVFRAGPVVSLVTALLALSLVPLGGHPALISFAGDFVLFAYLLGLGRFFTIAAALDTGSAFEGMGSAREAAFSCLTEPALFLGLVVLVRISSSLSLSHMLGSYLNNAWHQYGASLVLVVVSLFIILLAENSRIPFDDPNTHLELTMIHEVMVLDHSGPALGFIQYGAALKLFVMAAIIVRLIIPFNTGIFSSWGIFIVSMIGLAIGIGVIESIMARLRLTQVPILLIAACLLSAFGIILMAR